MKLSYWYFNKWLFIYNFTCSVIFDISMLNFQRWVNNTWMIKNWTMYLVNLYFVIYPPFLIFASIQFGFILYLLYYALLVLLLIYFMENPNILDAYFTALILTKVNRCEFVCLSLLISGVSMISIYIFWWFLCH